MMDVSKIISQWIKFVVKDDSLFENIQLSDVAEEVDVGGDSCCGECQCVPGTCHVSQPRGDSSNLLEFRYQCGCTELCYAGKLGKKVGRSQRTKCNGTTAFNEYRLFTYNV